MGLGMNRREIGWYRGDMGDPIGLNERLQLRRWLAAVGLTVAAEDAARVDTPATNAMALLGAHAACEALLGLLAGVRRHKPGDEVSFARLVDSAASKVTLASGMSDDLDAMHRIRNDFVHASNTVAADEAARAISNARRLMELVSTGLGVSGGLPNGAGLAAAVAEAIGVELVAQWLRQADQLQRAGELEPAADALACALYAALARTTPRLIHMADSSAGKTSATRTTRRLRLTLAGLGHDRDADETQAEIAGLHQWVLPLALGVSPAAYERLVNVIGTPRFWYPTQQPGPVDRPQGLVLNETDLWRATSQTSEIIFRLWAMGSLKSRSGDADAVNRMTLSVVDQA